LKIVHAKFQIPNPKHQTISNVQNPKFEMFGCYRFGHLEIGILNLFGIWDLVIGI
jgi:hypothetical protein